jgi:hypothetical protein
MSTTTAIKSNLKRHALLAPISAAIFAGLGAVVVGAMAPAAAAPLPYGPDTCIAGFAWREAKAGDNVCVTPYVHNRTQQENANAAQFRDPNGGPYGPDTCLQPYVWRDAFYGDHVCVTQAVRAEAAADNSMAEERKLANHQPPPAPLQGPGVSFSPQLAGLTVHVQDRSGVSAQCTYKSQFSERGFYLQANTTHDVVIVPAVRRLQNLDVSITCDNGTSTNTSTFF